MPGRTDWDAARVRRERDRFRAEIRVRPSKIDVPGHGQESVWGYSRPPRIERESRPVRVELAGVVLAQSVQAVRVLETSSPPTVYLPPSDVRFSSVRKMPERTLCEWKGLAVYWEAKVGVRVARAIAWSYPEPFPEYAALQDWIAFFPGRVDGCWLGEERVRPQPGEYYGGWVTDDVVGPFKGEPGSERW
ncbi:MAG: DUF427 domain-containing protein [Candidatus Binatia bacterium]|nr:DUF427 domain-containing protein [Candidatus Binatia bacterium]